MSDYDLIVIGGGPAGLSTAYHACLRGLKTLVIEKFNYFNDEGSSAGMSRQFRYQYEQKYMAQLVLASDKYWNDLQSQTSEELIGRVGSLWFGDAGISGSQEGGIHEAMAVMDELNIPYTQLPNKQLIEDAYKFKNLPAGYSGFFQPDGGIINFKATQQAFYDVAQKSGLVDLHECETVTDINPGNQGDDITIKTINQNGQKNIYTTYKLAITPGAYVNHVLQPLNLSIDLDIWEMSSAYYKKASPTIDFPSWFVFQEPAETSLFYGFPEVDWAHPGYIRVAPDIPDGAILKDPSERTGIPNEHSLALNSAWVRDHMIDLDPNPEFTATCLIPLDASGKKQMLMDYLPKSVPNADRIVTYTAGWAAKYAPILGEMILQLLEADRDTFSDFSFCGQSIKRTEFSITWKGAKQSSS
jgi:glycine/D-amino acid oxidase-like deaminating enzyme